MRPKLVVRCAFQEWTAGDRLRRASYVGVREDKDAKDVVRGDLNTVKQISRYD